MAFRLSEPLKDLTTPPYGGAKVLVTTVLASRTFCKFHLDVGPFYKLVPETLLLPMVVLATAATVIASQAVITGAYSLVHQAIQLGLLPRLTILHTSASHAGQIYIPRVTIALMIGVLLLVGLFRTSSALASAYGIAVATTMVVDGILAFVVIWKGWRWSLWQTLLLIAPFVVVDVVFFSANFLKLFEGAWAPLLFGATMVLLIVTWRRGTNILISKTRKRDAHLLLVGLGLRFDCNRDDRLREGDGAERDGMTRIAVWRKSRLTSCPALPCF